MGVLSSGRPSFELRARMEFGVHRVFPVGHLPLAAQALCLSQSGAMSAVLRMYHRIVRREPPFLAVLGLPPLGDPVSMLVHGGL